LQCRRVTGYDGIPDCLIDFVSGRTSPHKDFSSNNLDQALMPRARLSVRPAACFSPNEIGGTEI